MKSAKDSCFEIAFYYPEFISYAINNGFIETDTKSGLDEILDGLIEFLENKLLVSEALTEFFSTQTYMSIDLCVSLDLHGYIEFLLERDVLNYQSNLSDQKIIDIWIEYLVTEEHEILFKEYLSENKLIMTIHDEFIDSAECEIENKKYLSAVILIAAATEQIINFFFIV